ncbi:MAG: D-alanyl-D-alanine carboxypeptidase [Candidatus Woesebacteria bacterium]|nr:D-alanyl-D-alanine carboxypeptidase [Candidatus Woesebacteria bacterium]
MKKLLTKKNNYLYFLMLSFVFIASYALALSPVGTTVYQEINKVLAKRQFPPNPIISKDATFPIFSAQGVLVVDLISGVSLFEKDADKALLPASTTKIVTALVAMNSFNKDDVIEIGNIVIEGQKMGLKKGEKIKVSDLLYGLLVYSANDAAEALAQNYIGGRNAFILAMNNFAKSLYLENTNFTNPSGLDGNGDHIVSTARDLIRVSTYAMKNPEFAKIVATKEITVKSIDGKIVHKLISVNKLLGQVSGVLGVKTGWTENARENLVTYIERDSHKIMIAVLGSQDRFGETKELITWIFANYSWQEVKGPQ